MPLDPKAQGLLDMVYRVGAPRFHDLNEDQARRSFEKLAFALRPDAPAVASVTDVPVPRADGSVLMARLYRPLRAASADILPLLVYCHGGGWCIGDIESYDVFCRQLANGAGVAVLSVDYRLAPEHPFPAGFLDADLAVDWAIEHADLLGIDPARVAMGGDSAGGNLSLAVAIARRERHASPPLRQLALIYPCTQIESDRPGRATYGDGYFLDRESLRWFFSRYLPAGTASDWRASPMCAESLADLPPMVMVTAECDPLTDDCKAFAARVRAEGGAVVEREFAGMVHGFAILGGYFPQANQAVDVIGAALAEGLGVR
ncbi:alpha/beta hydrolase [Nitrogeniibacter mangrovi]|uniref:Alpha/beta hydrolase n=1 Tax=Nitrogeniibacter mangrovi TaxID=2016596 RepID=A0A6C1B5K1_9RHOO|nr:alpha/beta hydrolase [Nitrogeniibacter mangrovi]QID18747.1 alpha/beta hydrolase [Nitrogeniibacter mangrovi]